MEAEVFNDRAEACVSERHNINAAKRIYIHGTERSRIASPEERFSKSSHALDGFHLEKYLKKAGHCNGAARRMSALSLQRLTNIFRRHIL